MNLVFEFGELLQEDSKDEFILVWEKIFNRKLSEDFYKWIFNKNNHIFVARRGSTIVAGYCLLEIEIFSNAEKKRGLLCNNVFVDGYANSKLGLFKMITDYALRTLRANFELGLGFPNDKAIKAHLRSGWRNPFAIKFVELLVNTTQIKSIGGDRCLTIPVCSKNLDIVIESFRALDKLNYSFYVNKSIEYIRWRFIDNPRYSYVISIAYNDALISSFVISKYYRATRRVHAVDYAIGSSLDAHALVSEIVNYYQSLNLDFDVIDLWASDVDANIFLTAGFKDVGREQSVIINYLSENSNFANLASMPHFVLSDNDVY